MDTERVYAQLDRIEGKLDSHLERIVVVEEKQKSMAGQISLGAKLLLAAITTTIGYVLKQVFHI